MSEPSSKPADATWPATAAPAGAPFTEDEFELFHHQDHSAGRLMGLLLGGFFLFLLVLMIGVTLWTWAAVS